MLCFVVVTQSFIMNSHEAFIHIHQGCFAGTGAIVKLPQCQWSKPDGYGKSSQCITTTKHSKAKTVCIFLGIYCMSLYFDPLITVELHNWDPSLVITKTFYFSGHSSDHQITQGVLQHFVTSDGFVYLPLDWNCTAQIDRRDFIWSRGL